jgi:NAD-dependent dihydropyrimidine dehydrogenase PreA subunit
MAKNWFPIIDYEKCTSCFQCVEMCPHNVFVIENNIPIVANPENCVEFCRGCQKGACDFDAISFPADIKGGNVTCSCAVENNLTK